MIILGSLNLTANSSGCPVVTFTCSAVNFSSNILWWFLNNKSISSYNADPDHEYPLKWIASNATLNARVGGVQIQILSAMISPDDVNRASFLSTMEVNNSALHKAGIYSVSCGTRTENTTDSIKGTYLTEVRKMILI